MLLIRDGVSPLGAGTVSPARFVIDL